MGCCRFAARPYRQGCKLACIRAGGWGRTARGLHGPGRRKPGPSGSKSRGGEAKGACGWPDAAFDGPA